LRTELESRLRIQTRLIESLLTDPVFSEDVQIQERLRIMLETSTQTRLRIQQVDTPSEASETPEVTPEVTSEGITDVATTPDPAEKPANQNQNRNMIVDGTDQTLDQNKLYFRFHFNQPIDDGVYAEAGGAHYPCEVVDATVICDVTGLPGQGQLHLYHLATNDLLYMYDYNHDYEYLWLGTKDAGGPEYQGGETQPPDNAGGSDQGRNGKNQ
jgi:hypothetical protein